jgi:hypothetical protein
MASYSDNFEPLCVAVLSTSRELQCSTCSKLDHALFASKIPEIAEKCKECCIHDQDYDLAVIEVDKRFVKQFYPEVHGVLMDKALKGYVKLRNVENARPSLIMYSNSLGKGQSSFESPDDMVAGETVNIGSWKKDAIKEYLHMNIK